MKRFATPGWLLKHAIVVFLVVAFLALGWWQFGRAESGNALSLGYTFEWPLFAAFVIFLWVREMRLALRANGAGADTERESAGATAGTTPDLTAATDEAGVTTFDVGAALTRRAGEQRAGAGIDDDTDYNQYLAWLAAHPDARPLDYRRPHDRGRSLASEENAHG